jgi:hypothetical protein
MGPWSQKNLNPNEAGWQTVPDCPIVSLLLSRSLLTRSDSGNRPRLFCESRAVVLEAPLRPLSERGAGLAFCDWLSRVCVATGTKK